MSAAPEPSSLERYEETCRAAAAAVISAYSTSFGVATRMLGRRHRAHVRNIYALVRIADELVDGVAAERGIGPAEQRKLLRRLEDDVFMAVESGYSSNPIVDAFACTVRDCGIEGRLIEPFFASMRTDIRDDADRGLVGFDREQHAAYVYGSAEVVGLMCLRVFTREERLAPDEAALLERGARSLGAAFQNINFLRDLADDSRRLGRDYLGADRQISETDRLAWVAEARAQLESARISLPLLPKDARRAVRCALELFEELLDRISRTPAAELYTRRIRVPNAVKLGLAVRAGARTLLERT
ncbi:phytoene/squalene synthase family protein [Leucobacter ruminantium]